jgi:mannose-6-phosphate isomerase-like protein (cupin superfamily)
MARSTRWDLARLIQPASPDAFFGAHFEASVLHVPRDDAGYYHSLLRLEDIDRVLTTLHLSHPSVHMANAAKQLEPGDYTYPSGLIDAARLHQEYADGGTIVLNNLEGSLPTLADLCRSMEVEFSCRFQCNIYVTPGGSAQGLRTHYDTHDVFVLQIEGTKHWRIYDTPVERPFRGQDFQPEQYPPGELTMEFDLRPGDMVYVPRGVMHDATSTEADSCHITLGILPTSWTDLLLEAVARVGLRDSELRRSLPPGFARQGFDREEARATIRDLLRRVLEQAELDPALDHFAEDLVSTRHPLLYGQMQQIHKLPGLTVEDRAGARPNLLYHLLRDETHVHVAAYGARITLPLHAAEALEHALSHDEYRVGDLPGDLDDPGKLVLVRRLVREGLVQVL